MKKIILTLVMLLFGLSTLQSQSTLTNKGVLFIGNGSKLSVQGSYVHQSGNDGLQVDTGGELFLTGDFINESISTVSEGYTGKIIFNGSALQTIRTTGFEPSQVHEIELQNPAGLQLDGTSNVSGTHTLQSGSVDLATSDLQFVFLPTLDVARQQTAGTLGTEGTNRLFTTSTGKALTDVRDFVSPDLNSYVNVAGLGAEVRINGFTLGDVKMERTHLQQSANSSGESILRSYKITVRDGGGAPFSSLPGDLRFHYLDSELGTISAQEPNFTLFRSTDNGLIWLNMGGAVNAPGNYVDLSNITNLNGLWTVSYCLTPSVSLSPDVSICPQSNTTLTATTGTGTFTYEWFRDSAPIIGQVASTLLADIQTVAVQYSVTVTNTFGCKSSSSAIVNPRVLPVVSAGPDQQVCPQASAALNAGPGFSSYLWRDFNNNQISTTQTVSVSAPGQYTVTVTDAFGCVNNDAVIVNNFTPPVSNLPTDSKTCGTSILLGQGLAGLNPGATFEWRNAANQVIATTSIVTVSQNGLYTVTITDTNGCQAISQTIVTLNTANFVDLGPDVTMQCSSVTIDAGFPGSTFLWSDGSSNQKLTVTVSGLYWAEVIDLNACKDRDSVRVTVLPALDSAFFLAATQAFVQDTVYFIGLTTALTTSVDWAFGDGALKNGNETLTSHQYMVANQYDASMSVAFDNGCLDVYSKRITISEINEGGRIGGREAGRVIDRVDIYPNPNTGMFAVDIKLNEESTVALMIVNSAGYTMIRSQTLQGRDFYSVEYDLMGTASGVYILTLTAGHEGRQYRIVIE